MPCAAPSCHAGSRVNLNFRAECPTVSSQKGYDAGGPRLRGRDRPDLCGWHRAGETKPQFARHGQNCESVISAAGEIAE